MAFNNKPLTMRLGQAVCTALLAFCAAGAQAAGYAGTQFEIEMVVFARESGMSQSRESWPAAPRLDYRARWVDFDTLSGDTAVPALQPAPNQLDNKVAALKRAPGYQVLFHKTWRQVLQNKRNAPAVLISGGQQSDNHSQLEGSVTLSVSRYLHLSTDLWFSEWLPTIETAGQSGEARGIAVPARPRAAIASATNAPENEPLGLNGGARTESAVFHTGNSFSDRPVYAPAEKRAARVAVLQEERRLRSGELHYIDHPKLGVLVEVRPVSPQEKPQLEESGASDEPMELTP